MIELIQAGIEVESLLPPDMRLRLLERTKQDVHRYAEQALLTPDEEGAMIEAVDELEKDIRIAASCT